MYTSALKQLIEYAILLEFEAAYTYRAYGAFFDHPEVAYPGFAKYFKNEAEDELTHADVFIKYHQSRGGFATHEGVPKVDTSKLTPMVAFRQARDMEMLIRDNIANISKIADPQTLTFIDDYLKIQTDSIAEYTMLITKTSRMDNNTMGLYLLDLELQK